MPADVLAPIPGDPLEITAVAVNFSSIATEVAAAARRLRVLASRQSSWVGEAAMRARTKAASLPAKLDKATASYAAAGAALHRYAVALAASQQQAASAIAIAKRATTELAEARRAQSIAAENDVAQATAARVTGSPPPQPTAPRYQAAIEDATALLLKAQVANAAAHEEQRRAAHRAAIALTEAAREGIRNQSWWRHAWSRTAHWAATQWVHALRVVSRLAATLSALAGLAALVLSIAGVAFPPLEAAAALLETVSLVGAVVSSVSDAILAAVGRGSWATVAFDSLNFAPAGLSKVVGRAAPALRIVREKAALPAGTVLVHDLLGVRASRISPIDGFHDVVIHGSGRDFGQGLDAWSNGHAINHRALANLIGADATYPGGPVRLISCNAGRFADGPARDLANKLGVDVLAPTDTVWVHATGRMTIGPDVRANTGYWRLFKPGEGHALGR